jgi:hypothetical protein
MQYSGTRVRPAGIDTNRSTNMIQMMMATIGSPAIRHAVQHVASSAPARHSPLMLRRAMGLAIVAGGIAVVAGQALQHTLGG